MIHKLYNMDCLDVLKSLETNSIQCIFGDPPDNIGLQYHSYEDRVKNNIYYGWIEQWLEEAMRVGSIVWLSYNAIHNCEMQYIARLLTKNTKFTPRTFIWRFTFGSNQKNDCTNGYRPILRLMANDAKLYPHQIKVESVRQQIGDKRAAEGGKVPDDVWEFPRVTGNSHERRAWHPTQHPDQLIKRIILFSTREGDTVFDMFGGTGTVLRNCHRTNRNSITTEIDPEYCRKISEENNNIPVLREI